MKLLTAKQLSLMVGISKGTLLTRTASFSVTKTYLKYRARQFTDETYVSDSLWLGIQGRNRKQMRGTDKRIDRVKIRILIRIFSNPLQSRQQN